MRHMYVLMAVVIGAVVFAGSAEAMVTFKADWDNRSIAPDIPADMATLPVAAVTATWTSIDLPYYWGNFNGITWQREAWTLWDYYGNMRMDYLPGDVDGNGNIRRLYYHDMSGAEMFGSDGGTVELWFKSEGTHTDADPGYFFQYEGLDVGPDGQAGGGDDNWVRIILYFQPNDWMRFIMKHGGTTKDTGGIWGYPGPTVADGDWHHYAIVFDLSTGLADLYVDGVAHPSAGSQDISAIAAVWDPEDNTNGSGDNYFSIGAPESALDEKYVAVGRFDQFKIWDNPLSASEVATIYATGRHVGGEKVESPCLSLAEVVVELGGIVDGIVGLPSDYRNHGGYVSAVAQTANIYLLDYADCFTDAELEIIHSAVVSARAKN